MTKIFTKEIRAAINCLFILTPPMRRMVPAKPNLCRKYPRHSSASGCRLQGYEVLLRDQWLRDNEVPQIAGRPNNEHAQRGNTSRRCCRRCAYGAMAEKGQYSKVTTILVPRKPTKNW